ncbi:MAG: helix-turn-helix transcriptional regulator, partial [Epulopiscium sp.]|nr:helix-turn-helix transcriptional regulator [Candidatus Epulonipiscium sp.]
QYLLDYRLMKAKELLENTDYKVKDISDMSGFGTYNNFAKAFKKKIGSSPGSYRNACL